ncbi:MAG: glucose-6-phosphate isomerase [Acidobacteriota bacterium]
MSHTVLPPLISVPGLGFQLDFSGIPQDPAAETTILAKFPGVFDAMKQLEAGAIANPDEQRMVGHYWLRDAALAPRPELQMAIKSTLARLQAFGAAVRSGRVGPRPGASFTRVLHIGIGGSALGPQLATDCLANPGDPLAVEFLDNTDPEGLARAFSRLGEALRDTIVVVVSKSGGTPETRNGMLEAVAHLKALGCDHAKQMVAITGEGSELESVAKREGWLEIFPMWDWVGGRTSQTSAVGLVTMSLLGHDVDGFLDGARRMDAVTRLPDVAQNPAARIAMAWHLATRGRGEKAMVVLPYRDRLLLMSRYLQQLVMESLGKEKDLDGATVEQGIAVYGNKGSTDQHAYVQQLRDGTNDFFVTFIAALHDRNGARAREVEPGVTCGDYLLSFLLGTRRALMDKGRACLTITMPEVSATTLGALIALFERSVGFYANLVNVNAYHQPGVEAGKKAAAAILKLQGALLTTMRGQAGTMRSAAEWAASAGHADAAIESLWLLEHLAGTPTRGVKRQGDTGAINALFGV